MSDLLQSLTAIPDLLVTGSPEQVILKLGVVLALLVALFVLCIRMPLSSAVSPSVSLIMILAGVFFWIIALVTLVIALGKVDLRFLLHAFRG